MVTESADIPSYKCLVIAVRCGSMDETQDILGMANIIKEIVKFELQ